MAQTLSPDIITAAIEGLEARRQAIGRQIDELRAMLPNGAANHNDAPAKQRGGNRRLSPEARERIAEAQRRRWAAAKAGTQPSAPTPAKTPKKRRLSAAGRKAIQEGARRRWAAKRAEASQWPTKKAAGKKASAKTGKRAAVKRAAKAGATSAPAATEASA